MSTRSTIAMLYEDGKVDSIYCHNDGYLSNNGFLLYTEYQDPEKIKQLLSLGAMSSLEGNVNPTYGGHSFDNREDGVCVFYARDRNEDLHINHDPDLDTFLSSNYESIMYLYDEKKRNWYYLTETTKKLAPLYGGVAKELKAEKYDHKLSILQDAKELIKQNKEKIKLAKKLNKTLPTADEEKRKFKV